MLLDTALEDGSSCLTHDTATRPSLATCLSEQHPLVPRLVRLSQEMRPGDPICLLAITAAPSKSVRPSWGSGLVYWAKQGEHGPPA